MMNPIARPMRHWARTTVRFAAAFAALAVVAGALWQDAPYASAGNPPPPIPRVDVLPDGNANNVGAGRANLWLCQDISWSGTGGDCDDPGEGEISIWLYASDVHTLDTNGNTTEDGVGAYEFAVEFDTAIFEGAFAIDVVFKPFAGIPWPDGTDGVPDGEGGGRAPANCSVSFIDIGLFTFACITAGAMPEGPTGEFDMARIGVLPRDDIAFPLSPSPGSIPIVSPIRMNGCELVDIHGHPLVGSVNGGLAGGCEDVTLSVRMLQADVNVDCDVNVFDAQQVAYRNGAVFGQLRYFSWYDLEPDGRDLDIDEADAQAVLDRLGSTCQAPIPPQPPLP